MPTYEYKCDACGYTFEKFQNITDKPIKSCPECNAKVRRLIGAGSALIFKGSGFYATDYARQNQNLTRCGRDNTCCGRDTPCDTPPCKD